MQKHIIITFAAILFLLCDAMAAKLPRGSYTDGDENVVYYYDTIQSLDMHNLLTRENASPVDFAQREPFEEEIKMQTMGPPPVPCDPGTGIDCPETDLPIPGGLLVMFAFAGMYVIRLYGKILVKR